MWPVMVCLSLNEIFYGEIIFHLKRILKSFKTIIVKVNAEKVCARFHHTLNILFRNAEYRGTFQVHKLVHDY